MNLDPEAFTPGNIALFILFTLGMIALIKLSFWNGPRRRRRPKSIEDIYPELKRKPIRHGKKIK